jgi:hypothetical protein
MVADKSDDAGGHFHVCHKERAGRITQRKQLLCTLIPGLLKKISELEIAIFDADAAIPKCVFESGEASSSVGEVLWSGNGGKIQMTELNEVLSGEFGASSVVNDHGIDIFQPGLAVKVDQDSTRFLEGAQEIQIRSRRAIDDAGDFPLEQKLESRFFLGAIFVGVADQDGVPIISGFVFDRFDHCGKEKISDIGDHNADGSGLLGPQRASGAIGDVAMAVDGGEDALASWGSHIVGPAERSGNRSDAEVQLVSEILESHGEENEDLGGGKRGLDNFFARIITRCKVLHFTPPMAVAAILEGLSGTAK